MRSILIVDDSEVIRAVIGRILTNHPGFNVVGNASSAQAAIEFLGRNRCDLVLLDIEMPGRTGIEALPDILSAAGSDVPVMILSANGERGAPAAVQALALGAADTLAKPGSLSFSGSFSDTLIERIEYLCAKAGRRAAMPAPVAIMPDLVLNRAPGCIAIGASTGGLPATCEILRLLSPSVRSPILVTQHLPGAFMASYARQLQQCSDRTVVLAADGMRIEPDHVYVATGDAHLACEMRGDTPFVRFDTGDYPVHYTPAVDCMLGSVAACFGRATLGVILSGMGRDGLAAAAQVRKVRGKLIVQDYQSSVIWGMPGAIAAAGLADGMANPSAIAGIINRAGVRS